MSFHLEHIKELRSLISDEIKNTSEIIALGVAIKDFASYKEQVGRLFAYKQALELIDEAEKRVESRE